MTQLDLLNNRYRLEKRLGSGGMAVVYQAHDLTLERTVAIKVLRQDFSADAAFRERFHQEAKAAANLTHPNIVTVHDFGLDGGRLFIVMEYVPGTDLKTILQQRGRFTIEEAMPLIIQACAGLGYAHRAGLVHCDVKPHNILITPDQRVKITDFGIARALASIHPEEKSAVVWGSPQFFSPEQAAGGAPSPASDVYSLGVVIYEMLTGQLPFQAETAAELARLHRFATPPPPRQLNPHIPPTLEQIMLKVLSKEPSQRYRTADQLGRVLMSFNRPTRLVAVADLPPKPEPRPVPAEPLPPLTRPKPQQPAVSAVASYPARPPQPAAHARPTPPPPAAEAQVEDNPLEIDWLTWGLALLAFVAIGGLLPLWLYVYLLYR